MTFEEVLHEPSDKFKIYEYISDMLANIEKYPDAECCLMEVLDYIDSL